MELTSQAFEDGDEIPAEYAVQGTNEFPPLEFRDVPAGTESLALIFEDIDSPIGPVTHWIVWNIPAQTSGMDATRLPAAARVGINAFGTVGYDGPEPPAGRHHYRFRLLALDTTLNAARGEMRQSVENEMADHVIDEATLAGYFEGPEIDAESAS